MTPPPIYRQLRVQHITYMRNVLPAEQRIKLTAELGYAPIWMRPMQLELAQPSLSKLCATQKSNHSPAKAFKIIGLSNFSLSIAAKSYTKLRK